MTDSAQHPLLPHPIKISRLPGGALCITDPDIVTWRLPADDAGPLRDAIGAVIEIPNYPYLLLINERPPGDLALTTVFGATTILPYKHTWEIRREIAWALAIRTALPRPWYHRQQKPGDDDLIETIVEGRRDHPTPNDPPDPRRP